MYIITQVGDPTPSPEDINLTEKIIDSAEMMGVQVLDHVIIAKNGCASIRQIIQMLDNEAVSGKMQDEPM